ncbi:MAG TPA: acyl-CoA dehydratase activase, partial [Blastocatellia bacterium]|nr:acyl-CoA dehydratase activase [Blastocatellia bacterium]
MRNVAGIDIGTAFTKAVIIAGGYNERPTVIGRGATRTGVNIEQAAGRAFEMALEEAQLESSEVCYVTTTGFGRYSASFRDIQATEITSGARGAHLLFPQSTAVLDIGSQSTRAIILKEGGRVRSFKTNDKCAAGSGSFIVRAAKYLQIDLKDVGEMALKSTNPQPISSICAVLAESEIINHVSAGVGVEDILRGIYDSLADRAALLLKRAGPTGELTFIGGVANQPGMVKALEQRLKVKVYVPRHSEYVCALGAALLGLRRLEAARSPRSTVQMPSMG